MLTVRIQEKNHSESIMVLKLKDGYKAEETADFQKIPLLILIFKYDRIISGF